MILSGALLGVVAALAGCSDEASPATTNPPVPAAEAAPVLAQHVGLVHGSYALVVNQTTAMQTAINTFLTTPSEANLAAARTAWATARVTYGQTEAYRFYGGPIDNEMTGVEGQVNAWPMDENFVDYVTATPMSGIINDTTTYPTLSREAILMQNERGGETNIATGWHAIEFLLWGQDLSATGPGARPYTDYVTGAGGTAANQMRRGQYLRLVTEQLVADLTTVRDAWTPGTPGNYGATFGADTTVALRRMLTGLGSLSGAELAGERMSVAYNSREQENEHSCFSDTTHSDLLNNAIGIQNVYLGRLGSMDGPGLNDLVRSRDAALNTRMEAQLQSSIDLIRAIPAPFDQAILGADTTPGRRAIKAAIDALRLQRNTIVEVAARLGVSLTLEE